MIPLIALVADTREVLHQLTYILKPLNISVSGAYTNLQLDQWKRKPTSLWLVVSENADNIFDQLSEEVDVPILLADEIPSRQLGHIYNMWCSNLLKKVIENSCQNKILHNTIEKQPTIGVADNFRDVWVVAASVGGPEAVGKFFSCISPDLPVAFIYGQHIEANFAKNLLDIIHSNSQLKAQVAETNQVLTSGTVTVLPADKLTKINHQGQLRVAETLPWNSPYTPNLDQVVANVAQHFLYRMGVIIFSGMCDDGAKASIEIAQKGATVWAQSPEDCICDSMPEAVIESGLVSFVGDAKALAFNLNEKYSR